jgi:hypothetical protein
MNRNIVACAAAALLGLPAVAAPVVAIEGVVARGDSRVTDVFSATIEVLADNGDVLLADTEPSLSVEDGFFSVDVDLAPAVAALQDGQTLTVTLDLGDGVASTTRLGTIWRVASAARADSAAVVLVADALGDIPADDLIADASPLAVPMAFANIAGVPASITDGIDNGTVDALTGLAIAGDTLNVATGGVTDIAAGTLTGAQLQDGTVTSTQLAALTAAKVADGTLTAANFANGAFATTADVTGTASVFRNPAGCAFGLTSASTPTCERVGCGTNALRACTTATCEDVGPTPSAGTRFCIGTGEGFELVGRLIKNP